MSAIGPADLIGELGLSQGWREFIQARQGTFGIDITFAEPERVTIPAYAGSLVLRESRAVPVQ